MATIRDVAEMAGVSEATVSRILNDRGAFHEATRRRVFEAVQKLEYVPNPAARRLGGHRGDHKKPRTGMIAFVMREGHMDQACVRDTAHARMLFLMTREALRRRMHLFAHVVGAGSPEEFCAPLIEANADGAVAALNFDNRAIAEYLNRRIPLVLINQPFDVPPEIASVVADERSGMADVTRHLKKLGHARVGYFRVAGERRFYTERWEGFIDTARREGLEVPDEFSEEWDIWPETHEKVMDEFAERVYRAITAGRITALVCPGDVYAVAQIARLGKYGLRPGRDYSITGFDDSAGKSFLELPYITSVALPFEAIAKMAFGMLTEIMENGPDTASRVMLKTKLIERESTRPPRN